MSIIGNWTWKSLSNALFSPKATGVESKINEVKQRLPIPVFWLLGKTQSGVFMISPAQQFLNTKK